MSIMKRRQFIQLALAGSISLWSIKYFYYDKNTSKGSLIKDYLYEYGLKLKGAYIENLAPQDLEKIEARLISKNWAGVHSKADFHIRIKKFIQNDFSSNKVVKFNNWIITEFEQDIIFYSLLIKKKHGISEVEPEKSFETAKFSDFLTISNWGPKNTCVDQGFNQQSDGHSSHWFQINTYNGRLLIYIDNEKIQTTKGSRVLTTKIEGAILDRLIKTPRALDIIAYDPARNIKQKIGVFNIYPFPAPAIDSTGAQLQYFGEIEDWGPKIVQENRPEKASLPTLWIKSQCAPKDSTIYIGDIPLNTTIGTKLITGIKSNPLPAIPFGIYKVWLKSNEKNESLSIGTIKIN